MAGAKQYIDEILEAASKSTGTLMELRVSRSLWKALCEECAPADPEMVYPGVPIIIDDDPPTEH